MTANLAVAEQGPQADATLWSRANPLDLAELIYEVPGVSTQSILAVQDKGNDLDFAGYVPSVHGASPRAGEYVLGLADNRIKLGAVPVEPLAVATRH